jgi:hypothetical protein
VNVGVMKAAADADMMVLLYTQKRVGMGAAA